jgi:hypothetical protein
MTDYEIVDVGTKLRDSLYDANAYLKVLNINFLSALKGYDNT